MRRFTKIFACPSKVLRLRRRRNGIIHRGLQLRLSILFASIYQRPRALQAWTLNTTFHKNVCLSFERVPFRRRRKDIIDRGLLLRLSIAIASINQRLRALQV